MLATYAGPIAARELWNRGIALKYIFCKFTLTFHFSCFSTTNYIYFNFLGEVNGEKAASPPPPTPPQPSEPTPPATADPLPPPPPPVAEAPPPPPPPAEEAAPPPAQHNQYAWQRPIIQVYVDWWINFHLLSNKKQTTISDSHMI